MRKRRALTIGDMSDTAFRKIVHRIRKESDAYEQFARLLGELEAEAAHKPAQTPHSPRRAA